MSKSAGFTLIELIAVMLILAILAVVAVPQFVDLRDQAAQASVDGVAGALASASALNFANRSTDTNDPPTKGRAIADCDDIKNLLQSPLSSKYTITTPAPIGNGLTVQCRVTGERSKFADFPGIGID